MKNKYNNPYDEQKNQEQLEDARGLFYILIILLGLLSSIGMTILFFWWILTVLGIL